MLQTILHCLVTNNGGWQQQRSQEFCRRWSFNEGATYSIKIIKKCPIPKKKRWMNTSLNLFWLEMVQLGRWRSAINSFSFNVLLLKISYQISNAIFSRFHMGCDRTTASLLLCFQTSIAVRYTSENFDQAYKQTIGLDFFLKRIVLAGERG